VAALVIARRDRELINLSFCPRSSHPVLAAFTPDYIVLPVLRMLLGVTIGKLVASACATVVRLLTLEGLGKDMRLS